MTANAQTDRASANRTAIARVLASDPVLVAVRPAGEVVPGLRRDMILHAAPPAPWSGLSDLVHGGLIGAALFEGLTESAEAAEESLAGGHIRLGAAQDHGAMAGGAGAITCSMPVVVLEDRSTGRRAFHFLMEGFGATLILGVVSDEVLDRLTWLRDEVAPALDSALGALGGVELRPLMVEALRRGDELHNRNAAATSMLAEWLGLGFARAGVDPAVQARVLEFMAGNPQFFVACSLAASQLALAAAADIAGSSLLVACGANGRDCGIKVAGLGDRWFTAPAELPSGVLLPGFDVADIGPGCGDSLLVECAGLGATALPAAPALWPLLGVDGAGAERIFEETKRIALAEHPHFRVPALADQGVPTGIDVLEVVESGIRPVIDIVMVHPERGRGMIGFGLTSPPMACFQQAAEALDRLFATRRA